MSNVIPPHPPQPSAMSAAPIPPPVVVQVLAPVVPHAATGSNEVFLYSHTMFYYWWPVWAVGYLMAGLTYFGGQTEEIGSVHVLMYPSKNVGVIFTLTLLLVRLLKLLSWEGWGQARVRTYGDWLTQTTQVDAAAWHLRQSN